MAAERTSRLWEEMGRPRTVLAPMVDQSELPFRTLCRRHGAHLCVTPMFHAVNFLEKGHRERHGWAEGSAEGCGADRPLLVQFAANDPSAVVAASRHVSDRCDGIDLNLGVPPARPAPRVATAPARPLRSPRDPHQPACGAQAARSASPSAATTARFCSRSAIYWRSSSARCTATRPSPSPVRSGSLTLSPRRSTWRACCRRLPYKAVAD